MYLDEEGKQKDRTFCFTKLSLVVVGQNCDEFSFLFDDSFVSELHVDVNPTLRASVSV